MMLTLSCHNKIYPFYWLILVRVYMPRRPLVRNTVDLSSHFSPAGPEVSRLLHSSRLCSNLQFVGYSMQ